MKWFVILSFVITLSLINTMAWSIDKNSNYNATATSERCPALRKEQDKITKWIKSNPPNNASISCPSIAADFPLAQLERLSQEKNKCAEKTAVFLLYFYAIYAHQQSYRMCGLLEKEDLLISQFAEDGKLCFNNNANKVNTCFNNVNAVISRLKQRGEIQSAFELAKKTANSGDTTGVSQMIVATMLAFGEGVEKNTSLAIQWYKAALEITDDKQSRIDILISLSVAYEDLNDKKNAILFASRCANLGDLYCKKGYLRLTTT